MKWPTDKKTQQQYIALILIGVVFVIVILVMFVVTPIRDTKRDTKIAIEELKANLAKSDNIIRYKERDEADNFKALTDLKSISENCFLKAVLGNYLLVAREVFDAQITDFACAIEPVREVGPGQIPYLGAVGVVNSYTARIALRCGLHDLVRLLRRLETSNPYATLTTLTVSGLHGGSSSDYETKENHSISFDIQWPIWANPEMPLKIEEQLEEAVTHRIVVEDKGK